ncbi:hypothetical protein P8C59_008007 [Phyllachora maydis]|uniref:Transcription initiation factor TFIID subunit 9 n=1 Tax=Phyllachora maydis TaxID=1825666 RepID=A0AAD9MJ65_9PEZI|nr:hypothetical protein P8C59_008007 [Phyllachora maydis]
MSAAVSAPQTNGAPPPAPASQTTDPTPAGAAQSQPQNDTTQATSSQTTQPNTTQPPASQPPASQPPASQLPASQPPLPPPPPPPRQPPPGPPSLLGPQPPSAASSHTAAARPRDVRTLELLLTAQGVTSYEARVPQLLIDFAYRHTAAVLSDALHLSGDPVTNAGRPAHERRDVPQVLAGPDAVVSANAVQLAIAARLHGQFRGGGASKEWMQELARERNKNALPKVGPNEWGLRLPSEKFVLTGMGFGLRHAMRGQDDSSGDDEDDEDEDLAMQEAMGGAVGAPADGMDGVEAEDVGGDPIEGGTVADVFGDDVDVEMEE